MAEVDPEMSSIPSEDVVFQPAFSQAFTLGGKEYAVLVARSATAVDAGGYYFGGGVFASEGGAWKEVTSLSAFAYVINQAEAAPVSWFALGPETFAVVIKGDDGGSGGTAETEYFYEVSTERGGFRKALVLVTSSEDGKSGEASVTTYKAIPGPNAAYNDIQAATVAGTKTTTALYRHDGKAYKAVK